MIFKFLKLVLSDVRLTLRLIHPRRIKNAIRFLIVDNGNLSQLYRRYQNIYGVEKIAEANSVPSETLIRKGMRDIFIFPVIDWDFRHQRPQHIATNLAKQGYRVFYFSIVPLVVSGTRGYQLTETSEKLVYLCKLFAPSGLNDDLHRKDMGNLTAREYSAAARAMIRDLKIVEPAVIVNHYYWAPLCRNLPRSALIYDCMDHHVAFFESTRTGIPAAEKELINECDCVVTSSTYLHEKVNAIRSNTLIRNGCDSAIFSSVPKKLSCSSPPVAGYIGAISDWFDSELVAGAAKLLPFWRFVLIGSLAGGDIQELKKLPNVELVGEVEYSRLPDHLAQFNVCIIPFKLTELTKATNPVKVYEYISAGRPVVATSLPELLLLKDLVAIADTPRSFSEQLEHSLSQCDDMQFTIKLKTWAKHQDWLIRTKQLALLIEDTVAKNAHKQISKPS